MSLFEPGDMLVVTRDHELLGAPKLFIGDICFLVATVNYSGTPRHYRFWVSRLEAMVTYHAEEFLYFHKVS